MAQLSRRYTQERFRKDRLDVHSDVYHQLVHELVCLLRLPTATTPFRA